MACKKFLLIFILLITASFIAAQDSVPAAVAEPEAVNMEDDIIGIDPNANYYLDLSEGEPRFIQKLFWEGDEYVLRYVLIIQKRNDDGSYTEVERLDTEFSTVEVSLYAGLYRYSLEVYDLFDDYAFTTNWLDFEVIRAVQPLMRDFSPNQFYLDEEENWVITVQGQNFLPQTMFRLIYENSRISPQRVTLEGERTAYLQFNGAALSPGKYKIYARNPGGLEHTIETFSISNKKPFDFNIALIYTPVFPVHGYLFKDGFVYEDRILEAPFNGMVYPLSGGARISFLPVKRTWGNMGIELSGSYAFLSQKREYYTTNANLIIGHAGILYQKHFLKRTFYINLNIGGGIFYITDFAYTFSGNTYESTSNMFFSGIAGASLTYMFKKPFFATLGAEFIQVFTPPIPDSPMPSLVRPFLGVGVQL